MSWHKHVQALTSLLLTFSAAAAGASKLNQEGAITVDELTAYVSQQLENDLSSPSTTVQALDLVPSPATTTRLCEAASQQVTSPQLSDAASGAIIMAKLQCAEKSAAVEALPRLWQLASHEETTAGYAIVLSAARHLAASSKIRITPEQTEAVGKLLTEVKAPSGKARSQAGHAVSILSTGYAYKILAEARALKMKWSGKASSAAADLTSQMPEVLGGASATGFTAAGDGNGLQALSQFLEGLISIDAKAASPEQLALLMQYVLSFRVVGSFEEAVWLLKAKLALKALSASGFTSELRTPFLTRGEDGVVEIATVDEEGKTASAGTLAAVIVDSRGKRVAEMDALEGRQGVYSLDALEHINAAGQYKLSLSIKSGGASAAQDHVLTVKEASQFSSASLKVVEKDHEVAALEASWPHPVETALDAPAGSTLSVTLSGATAETAPVLKLACINTNEAVVAAFKKGSVAKVSIDTVLDELECREVEASIQPASGATDTIWNLGLVELSGGPAKQARPDIYGPKPVISHLFRKPDKRPLEFLSYLFAIIAALPLLGLVFSLHQCNANLKGLLSNSKELSLPAFVYHSSLVGLVLLYSAFWLKLNLLQTLPLLALLAVVLSVSGYFLLSTQAALRLKQR